MKKRFLMITLAILTMGLFVTSNVRAGGDEEQPDAPPQPQSAVGRISVIHGTVSTMRGDGGQWAAGTVNTPVVPGDRVSTADRSRAEIQLDFADILRLNERTEAQVADLEEKKIDIQLASGLVDFSVLKDAQADAEIDTPNMGVHPLSPGVYRVQVNSPTETLLIVLQGEAEVLTNQGSTKVETGQIIEIHGSDNPEYKVDPAPAKDDFDNWAFDRDRQIASAQSWQHSDPQYTGSSDLDNYGRWSEVPDYGWCWTPQVDAGWVPYGDGSWGDEPYWGPTWISNEPWGWAPYHYGRWFMYGGSWRWWPNRGFGARWSPAYVSFFGFGGRGVGVGVGFGFGSVGWLALGPRDVFHPWFGGGHPFGAMGFNDIHGAGFIRPGGPRFGSNLESMATDAHIRGAIRNVSSSEFGSGRMAHSTPVSESMLHSGSMMRGSLPMAHSETAMGNRAGNFSSNRSAASGEHFFSRSGASMNSMGAGRMENGQAGARGSSYSWQRYSNGSSSGRWPTPVSGGGSESGASRGNQYSWQRYANPSSYASHSASGAAAPHGGWQGYSRNYSGSGARPSLNLNPPIMRQRAPNSGYNGSGNRSYSAPSGGGGRTYSAPSGGASHSSSAPHSSGGGGGHSGGGGHH